MWPPPKEIKVTSGLKMKDLRTSFKQEFADSEKASNQKTAKTSTMKDDVLAVLVEERRWLSANEICAILRRSKTPIRDCLNELIADKMARSMKINRLMVYEATKWALQKADD